MATRSYWEKLKRLWVNLVVIGLGATVAAGASYGLRWLGY
jgi:hypothetical protein